MAAKRDFYEVLGIDKNADEATIKKAYRKLAKKYHPDMNKGNPNAEKIFQEVTEAYEVLGDPKKRKLYDEYGPISLEAGFDPEKMKQAQYGNPFGNGGFYQSYSSGEPGSGYQEFHFDGSSDMDDILDKLFGKKGGFHGTGGFGGRSGFGSTGEFGSGFGGVHEKRGQNIETEVPISFEEAVFGCDKRFTLSSSDGKSQNFEVHIPAGIANGQSVRLKGKGQKGYNGKDGDLLIKVKVGEKSGYERKGQDVYTTVKIPYTTAVLGGEIKIHTLYGDVVCKIKPGTQSGAKIRLKGKGVAAMNNPAVHGVMLAAASNAIIVGFNVRPDSVAESIAERDGVDMRMYRIIYDCIEEISDAIKGMLAPKYREVTLGKAEVRNVFKLSSAGMIAGSYVLDGKITRNSQIRVVRDGIVVSEDSIASLKRFKDDVKEVQSGYECGIGLEKFNDIKEGDILEAFVMEEYKD